MDRRVEPERRQNSEELMLLNCGAGENSWESLGIQYKRSNQSILKETNPEYSWGGLMLKLKRHYFGHLWCWLIGKDTDAGKDQGQEEKGMTDEMVGWHHQLNGHRCEQTQGDNKGQRSLVCCSPWGCQSQIQLSNWTTTRTLTDDVFVYVWFFLIEI